MPAKAELMRMATMVSALSLSAQPVAAQRFDDTISLRVESYFAGVGTSARAATVSGNFGTSIDFEDDLSLAKSKILPALEFGWRINDDWVVHAQYYGLSRRSDASLAREISFGETVWPVSARVGAGFDSDIYRFTIGNLIHQGPRLELGLGFGVHATNFQLFIEGEGQVGEGPCASGGKDAAFSPPCPRSAPSVSGNRLRD